jgi:hypothetical protein
MRIWAGRVHTVKPLHMPLKDVIDVEHGDYPPAWGTRVIEDERFIRSAYVATPPGQGWVKISPTIWLPRWCRVTFLTRNRRGTKRRVVELTLERSHERWVICDAWLEGKPKERSLFVTRAILAAMCWTDPLTIAEWEALPEVINAWRRGNRLGRAMKLAVEEVARAQVQAHEKHGLRRTVPLSIEWAMEAGGYKHERSARRLRRSAMVIEEVLAS